MSRSRLFSLACVLFALAAGLGGVCRGGWRRGGGARSGPKMRVSKNSARRSAMRVLADLDAFGVVGAGRRRGGGWRGWAGSRKYGVISGRACRSGGGR